MIDDRYRGGKMTKKEFILRSIEKGLKEKGRSEKEIQEYLEKAKNKLKESKRYIRGKKK